MSSMQFLFHGLDENENKINSQTHTHHYAFETWLPSHSSVRFSYKYSGASFTSIAWKILKTSKNYISTSYSDAHEEFLHLFLWVWTGCIVQNARWPYNSTNSFIGSISLPKDPKENKQDAVDILCHYKGLTKTLQKETKRNKKKGALTSLFVSVNFKAESGYRISQDDNISRTHLSSTRQAESELDPERRELLDRWKLTEDPAVRYPVKTASIWREEWVWKVFCSCCIWTHRQIFILLYKARSLNDPEVWKMQRYERCLQNSVGYSMLFRVLLISICILAEPGLIQDTRMDQGNWLGEIWERYVWSCRLKLSSTSFAFGQKGWWQLQKPGLEVLTQHWMQQLPMICQTKSLYC